MLKITGTVELADGTPVAIRKLSGKALRRSSEARQAAAAANARNWGGELLKELSKADSDAGKAEREKRAADPATRYHAYDRNSVLRDGVTGPAELLPDPEDQLDDADAEKTFRAIVDLSVPTAEQSEAATKNA